MFQYVQLRLCLCDYVFINKNLFISYIYNTIFCTSCVLMRNNMPVWNSALSWFLHVLVQLNLAKHT